MTDKFWVSWIERADDYRPTTYPPNGAILGWWCSGYDVNDGAVLCALVAARSEASAKAAIVKDWPEASEWRFCEGRGSAWTPGDRFALEPWMEARYAMFNHPEDGAH